MKDLCKKDGAVAKVFRTSLFFTLLGVEGAEANKAFEGITLGRSCKLYKLFPKGKGRILLLPVWWKGTKGNLAGFIVSMEPEVADDTIKFGCDALSSTNVNKDEREEYMAWKGPGTPKRRQSEAYVTCPPCCGVPIPL